MNLSALKYYLTKAYSFVFFVQAILLTLLASCTNSNNSQTSSKDSFNINCSDEEQFNDSSPKIVHAEKLELTSAEYFSWLIQQKGLTYNSIKNDTIELSVVYHPAQLQAAMGMDASEMSFDELLKSKKEYHFFLIDCLYKKNALNKRERRNAFFDNIYKGVSIVENKMDTLDHVMIESFKSPIENSPDRLMIVVPNKGDDIECLIYNNALGFPELKIGIPNEQIEKFPKVKI